MVVDRIRTGGLLLLPEDSVITAVPSIALVVVELSVIAVVVVAEVSRCCCCAFSAGCDDVGLSGTCLEKNNRATLIF